MKLLLASTGGSGSGYTLRLLYHLASINTEIHWIISDNFLKVLATELDFTISNNVEEIWNALISQYGKIKIKAKLFLPSYKNIGSEAASGSARFSGMIILPCSMKTLSGIANGYSTNLIERAADVSLKEERKLILIPRETPYSLIHLENMSKLKMAGATILPASPGFYHRPQSINDLYDFIVDRILLQLNIDIRAIKPWTG